MKLTAVVILFFSLITQVCSQDKTVSEINAEIQKVLQEKDAKVRDAKLKQILQQVKIISSQKEESGLLRQIALCNYLIEQACILEALDGRGVGVVRKELTENINDHGLNAENKRYLRRLVELCEEAERSYSNVSYVEVDGSDAKADLLVSNIGAGVGISLALGDVTPLIASAVRIGRGYSNINKTKSRQLETLIQSHKARITNFLFNVNSFKNDLIAEKGVKANQIITPESYREFLKVLMIEDYLEKLKKLEELNQKFPEFRALQFYLGEEYLQVKKTDKAVELFNKLTANRNPLIHKDGFVGQAFTSLAKVNLQAGKSAEAVEYASEALKENSLNSLALMFRSESYLKLEKYEEAFADAVKAESASDKDPLISWQACKAASYFKKDQVSYLLGKAIDKGFRDFETVRALPGMRDSLPDWDVKSLLAPEVRASYAAGVFKDDIIIENTGKTALDKFIYKVDLRYYKNDKWEQLIIEGAKPLFEKGEKLILKNKFSMKKDSRCSIKVTFTSLQNTVDRESVNYFNFEGQKQHYTDWEYDVRINWPKVLKTNSKDILTDLRKTITAINEKSFYQSPDALSLLAQTEFKLGNKEKAVNLQKKALAIMKRTLPESIYKISSIPFEQALIKFSE